MIKNELPFEEEWEALHSSLLRDSKFLAKDGVCKIAGLFRPCTAQCAEDGKRILYVGKATADKYQSDEVGYPFFNYRSSAFWRFARELSGDPELKCVTWTNLCKIGDQRRNPSGKLLKAQRDLAIKTLQEEIRRSNAVLVVFVSGYYADDIVYNALNIQAKGAPNDFETIFATDCEFWFRKPIREGDDLIPALLWVPHPQSKKRIQWNEWIKQARFLTNHASA